MTDAEVMSGAFEALLGDLFVELLYCEKGVPGVVESATGCLYYYLNDEGREVLRQVVGKMAQQTGQDCRIIN